MNEFERELKLVFLEEARTLLEEAEQDGLALAQGKYGRENIQKLFRIAHTFKGSAKAAGFDFLSQMSHEFENVLDRLEKGTLGFDKEVAAVLIAAIDSFKTSVDGLIQNFDFRPEGLDQVMGNLKRIAELTPTQEVPTQSGSVSQTSEPFRFGSRMQVSARVSEDIAAKERRSEPTQGPSKPAHQEMIRINPEKLDRLVDLISELRVHRKQKEFQEERGDHTEYIDKIITEAYDLSVTLRMTPLAPVFKKMQRVVWDASQSLGKDIEFQTSGEEVELDKVIVEKVSEVLTHLMRNAVDHGIESAGDRVSQGKPASGLIKMAALIQDNRVQISISDDGAGLNRERILKKGLEKGLVASSKALSDSEIFELIFEPGFSTRDQVTDLSGRGFGMDVVKAGLQEMGGTIEIQSQPGVGTSFYLSLPLILAMIEGLVCEVDERKYIISLTQVHETVDLNQHELIRGPDGSVVFHLRGDVIPVVRLGDLLHGQERKPKGKGLCLILGVGVKKVGFEVDRLIASQALTLRSLGAELTGIPGIKACAILNDGEPALVLHLVDFLPVESVHERW